MNDYQSLRKLVINAGLGAIPREKWGLTSEMGESLIYVDLTYRMPIQSKENLWNLLKEFGTCGAGTSYCIAIYLTRKFPSTVSLILSNEKDPEVRRILKISNEKSIVACELGRLIFDEDFLFLEVSNHYPMLEKCMKLGRFDIGKENLERVIELGWKNSSAARFLLKYYVATGEKPPKSIWLMRIEDAGSPYLVAGCHYLIEALIGFGKMALNPEDPEERKLLIEYKLAVNQAGNGYIFKDPEILKIPGVASALVLYYKNLGKAFVPNLSPQELKELGIVALYVLYGIFNADISKIMKSLKFSDRVRYAREYAMHGIKITDNFSILKQRYSKFSYEHTTIAHVLARKGVAVKNSRALALRDPNNLNRTVAHDLAEFGVKATDDPKILTLEDNAGNTVAHLLAQHGFKFSSEIMELKNNLGISVSDMYEQAIDRCMKNAINSF